MTISARSRASVATIIALLAALLLITLPLAPALAEGPSDGGGSQASDAGGAVPSIMERTTIYDETGLIDQDSLRNSIGNLKNVPDGTRIVALISDDLDPNNYDSSVGQRLEALNRDIVNGGQLQVNHVIIAVSPNLRKLGFYVGDAQPYPNGVKEDVISAMTPHAQNAAWETSVIAGLNTYFMASAHGTEVAAPITAGPDQSKFLGMDSGYWWFVGMVVVFPLAVLVIFGLFVILGSMRRKRTMKHLANMTPRGRRLWDDKFRPELEGYVTRINGYAYDVDRMTYVPKDERDEKKRELRKSSQSISTLISDAGSMRGNAAEAYTKSKVLYSQVEDTMTRWGCEQIKEHLGDIQALAANDSSVRARLNQNQSTSLGGFWIPLFLIHYVATQTPGTTAYANLHAPTSTSSSSPSSYSPSSYSPSSYSPSSYGGMSGGSASF